MNDILLMQFFASIEKLVSYLPNVGLVETPIFLISLLYDFMLQISSIRVLHNNAQRLIFIVEKGSFIADYIGNPDGSEESNLIQGVLFLL